MAITETPTNELPPATEASADVATGFAVPAPRGVAGVLGSGDHKTLGRLWIGTSLVFGVVSLAFLAWFEVDAMTRSTTAGVKESAAAHFTLGTVGLVLGFLVPLFIGLATLVVPLQVGAATIAFPRAAAAALWAWIISAVVFGVSYLPGVGGGIGGSLVNGSVLAYLALIGLVGSLLLGAVCVTTTVITLRPPGMDLDMVPLFSWSMVVASALWILTLPALAANAAFILVDLKYGAPARFGVRDAQWEQLGWLMTPPQAFAYAIPLLGIAGDVVATFAKRRQAQRWTALVAIGAFGALSFGAYAQRAFDPLVYRQWTFVAQCALVILPVLLFIAGVGAGLRHGVRSLTSPLVLAMAGLLLLLLGVLTSAVFGVTPLGVQTTNKALIDSTPALTWPTAGAPIYAWGVFGFALAAGLTGAVAGLVHWSSKITGRQLPDSLGKLLALGLLVGGVLFGAPLLILGLANQFDGLADAGPALFLVSLIGLAVLLGLAALTGLLVLSTRAAVLRGATTADGDPWGSGPTLEWATDSPPSPGNFGTLPVVTSPEPVLDLADGGAS
jgi:cytochrome c oxidase subunit 1